MGIERILVANRGEIAVRVIRTAQALGYSTVAVFSDADAEAPHVTLADRSVRIGPPEVGESYLHIDRIIEAARKSGANAIHPGYGFLSENAAFARAVTEAGLTWIGPSPESIEIMGNKAAAKRAIGEAAVPMIPGYAGSDQSNQAFQEAAADIGYPIMVKAAAGGGGRGMRLVEVEDQLAAALDSARSESEKGFGSAELLLEKAIVTPRHVEFQVFGDQHGQIIHLGERDCSVQRRHQKVIEEAPSPAVDGELRAKMGEAAVAVAQSVGYVGAGTVEFLLDPGGRFYFIEMNTRLQVEHPVTECITGLDLVEWQIRIADGQPLPLTQDEVTLNGHAIEVRFYAEDPDNQFLPSVGPVIDWRPPSGEGVRVDDGLRSGLAITPYYDAMIAKIITAGPSREVARRRLSEALKRTVCFGIKTNQQFLIETVNHPVFAAGEATTGFIDQNWVPQPDRPGTRAMQAVAAILFHTQKLDRHSPLYQNWHSRPTVLRFEGSRKDPVIHLTSQNRMVTVEWEGTEVTTDMKLLDQSADRISVELDDQQLHFSYSWSPDQTLWLRSNEHLATYRNLLLDPPDNADSAGSGRIVAPMPGQVIRLQVEAGEAVTKGQPLLILEAMKMEHTISAPFDGVVHAVHIETGQQMKPQQLMVEVEATQDHDSTG